MLSERAERYYLQDGLSCAQSIFFAANDEYNLGLTKEDGKLVSAFAGGMGCGNVCGALTGALSVLGKIMLTDERPYTPEFKIACATLVEEFEKALGDTLCSNLTPKFKTEENRCVAAVKIGGEVLEKHIHNLLHKPITVTQEDITRVKALGFLHCKGTNNFNCRIITRNGKITNAESLCLTQAAEKYGNGEIAFTSRLTIELQGVPYENIEPIREFLSKCGLMTGGTGSKVRPVVACKGTTCQYGLCDTFALSNDIHEKFFMGYNNVKLPHKFKIAVGGCPNNCVKPDLNDLGVVGQRVPHFNAEKCKGCKGCTVEKACPINATTLKDGILNIDKQQCNNCGRCVDKCLFDAMEQPQYGYKIYIGGRWGKKCAQGIPLNKIFTSQQEVMEVIEKAILLFRDQGHTGERFADTVNRIGFENVEKQLLDSELLARKEEIINAQTHLVGGATC